MTDVDFDNAIANQQMAIASYRREIEDLEERIEKLCSVSAKIEEFLNDFALFHRNSIGKLSGITHIFTCPINENFFSDLKEAIGGAQYIESVSSLENACTDIDGKVKECDNQISQKMAAIAECNSSINNLQSEKQAYLSAQNAELSS